MKTDAIRRLREKLAADKAVYGLWITLESPSLSEMAVALGLDWVLIDAEHGHLDWKDIIEHVRAAVRSHTVVLVRIAELNTAVIKRVLDIGADGVVIPWIETAEQLNHAVASAHYPPDGLRGIGAERATGWGQCFLPHTQEANEHVLVVPMIESVTAGRNINELAKVKGAEIYFIGPADYSSSAGHRGHWEGPGIADELKKVKDVLRANGKHCGIISTSEENLIERRQQGFRVLALGADSGLLLRSLRSALGVVGQDRIISPGLHPDGPLLPATPLRRQPLSMRPDRLEALAAPGQNPSLELFPGVFLDTLSGAHNGARNITAGLVTVEPGKSLPYHTHPVSESITALSGPIIVAVEGREYSLKRFDNVLIPRGLAHSTRNPSVSENCRIHVALASDSPSREIVPAPDRTTAMPFDTKGEPGKERVTRFESASQSQEGLGCSFIEYFNADVVPGVEISGGFGWLQPGSRLPAHFHDFDESVCVVQGTGLCLVEGRPHQISERATMLLPHGRIHSFINENPEPMAMIWIYAGPRLEQYLVDEFAAVPQRNSAKV